ncbi:MAG TPA: choice-of-anchor Q domain-containing protein, partial [bacterium]|nr:choice-of-anchor Q domain-containing protein [bacterium]
MCQKPLLLITIICNLCFFSFNAHAAASRTFTVDSTGDESDSSLSDVDCKTAMGRCTLRAAIEQANSLTSSTKIIFKATVITITMGADLPSIEAEIEIEGHDNLTISGDDKYSLSVLSGGQLTVSTVSFVKSYFHNAGTLAIKECSLYGFFGGTAIMNIGELELNHSKVSHSQGIALNSQNRSTITYSTIDNSNSEYTAVAISCDEPPSDYNSLGMSHSTISDNRGAGISIGENCKADIATSTISHNQGTGGFGGLYNEGTTTLKNVTIANNVACRLYCDSGTIGGGGIIDSSGDGSLALIRTLLVGNQYYDESDNLQNNNCSGVPFEHVSGSISDDASCKLQDIDTFSQDDLDVKLEALADNGGDTKTHMLGKNSPAIDFGNILSYADLTDDHTDQRGLDLGALYDIGSIDVQDKDTDGALENEDCDDDNPAISPLASETCNGIDDDCDGEIDGASAVDVKHWYEDTDGDNYGNPAVSVRQCFAPAGFDPDNTDCDDNNADANPGETEAC